MTLLQLVPESEIELFEKLIERYPFDLEFDARPNFFPAYTHKLRSYHDLRHIADLLEMLNRYLTANDYPKRTPGSLADRLIKAIWIHDMVQDNSGESEAKSYELAAEQLKNKWSKAALERLKKVVRPLVMATAHFAQPNDMSFEEQLMADIDLTPLGVPYDEFLANGKRVRAEFPEVPKQVYAAARVNILNLFLRRPRIYFNDWFYQRYETRARANLRADAQRLESIAQRYSD